MNDDTPQTTLFDDTPTGDGHAAEARPPHDAAEARPGYQHVKRVGWIPEAWEGAKVGELLNDISAGYSVKSNDRPMRPGEVGVLKVSAVSYDRFLPEKHKAVLPEDRGKVKESPCAGRLLISRSNTEKLVGSSVYVDTDHPDLFLPDTLWQMTVKEDVSTKWLNYALASDRMRFNIQGAAMGTSGSMKKISMKRLRRLEIALPPLPEQRQIAGILATWDRALEQIGGLIAAKERRLRGLMQRLLTGAVRFTEFEGEAWREVTISELLKRVRRPVDWDDEAEYDLVSVSRGSKGLYHRETVHGSDIKTKKLHILREGDFVISRMQVVHGATALVTPEFDGTHASNSYIILVPRGKDQVDPGFFARLSKLPHMYHLAYLSSYGVHIEKMTFNPKFYYKSKVRIPPTIEEQQKIAATLSAAEAEVEALRRQRKALRRQKKGVMQRLLTGAVRVPAAQEAASAKDLSGLEDLNRSGGRRAGGEEA